MTSDVSPPSLIISGGNDPINGSTSGLSTLDAVDKNLLSRSTYDAAGQVVEELLQGGPTQVIFGVTAKVGFITGSTDHETVMENTGSQRVSAVKMASGDRPDLSGTLAGVSASNLVLCDYVRPVRTGSDTTFILPTQDTALHESGVAWVVASSREPEPAKPTKPRRKTQRADGTDPNWHRSDLTAHFSRIELHLVEAPRSLTDHEMLELTLYIALAGRDPRSITRALLAKYHTLGAAVAAPVSELQAIRGLGKQGVVALKLVHATTVNILRKKVLQSHLMSSWDQLIDYLSVSLINERVETFHLLFLNNGGTLIADEVQGYGTINRVSVYPREVVRRCLDLHATALIMVHNHPCGNPTPSPDDVTITLAVQRAAAIMGIELHDHVIVGTNGYRSFRHENLI